MDLVTGNFSGGLNYFSRNGAPEVLLGSTPDDQPEIHSFPIHPNPASGKLFIDLPPHTKENLFRVEILNLLGIKVFSQSLLLPGSISLPNLPDGLYLVTLKAVNGTSSFSSQKLIISH